MESSTSILVFLAVFSLWCYFYWRPRRKIWAAARLIPGPKSLPLIGNIWLFLGDRRETFAKLLNIRAGFGDIARLWLFNRLFVVIAGPEDIKSVFTNPRLTNRGKSFSVALQLLTGENLFGLAGEEWRARRKLINPMFSYKVLESYAEIFGAKAKILVDKLNDEANGKTFNVNEKLWLCSADGIIETLVGVESNAQDTGRTDLRDAYHTFVRIALNRVLFPWLRIPWLYPLTSDGRSAKEVLKTFDAHYSAAIAGKLAAYRQGNRHTGIETESGKTVPSFLDLMVKASETQGTLLTEQEIQTEVVIMAGAGLLTLSHTTSTVLILIGIHHEWQDALFNEMTEVFAEDMTRSATHQDLSRMPVLDRVVKETFRLFPVVSVTIREINEDVLLPSGYTIPAGCSAVVPLYFVHREPKNFPKPHEFLPDRWLPGSGSTDHSFAYAPFGGGPRNCLGQKYTLLQIKSTLCQLVRKFKISTDSTMKNLENLEMEPLLKLQSGGYQLKLEKRDL